MSSSITRFSSISFQPKTSSPSLKPEQILSKEFSLESLDTTQKVQSVYEALSSFIQQQLDELCKIQAQFREQGRNIKHLELDMHAAQPNARDTGTTRKVAIAGGGIAGGAGLGAVAGGMMAPATKGVIILKYAAAAAAAGAGWGPYLVGGAVGGGAVLGGLGLYHLYSWYNSTNVSTPNPNVMQGVREGAEEALRGAKKTEQTSEETLGHTVNTLGPLTDQVGQTEDRVLNLSRDVAHTAEIAETALDVTEAYTRDLESKITRLTNKLTEKRSTITQLRGQIAAEQSEITQLREQVAELGVQLRGMRDLESEITQLREELATQRQH